MLGTIGWFSFMLFVSIFYYHHKQKMHLADCLRFNMKPQHPINHCQTLEERARLVDAYLEYRDKTFYKEDEDDDEEDEDDE